MANTKLQEKMQNQHKIFQPMVITCHKSLVVRKVRSQIVYKLHSLKYTLQIKLHMCIKEKSSLNYLLRVLLSPLALDTT